MTPEDDTTKGGVGWAQHLQELLAKAKAYQEALSPIEREVQRHMQRIDFAHGNTKLSNPDVTRDMCTEHVIRELVTKLQRAEVLRDQARAQATRAIADREAMRTCLADAFGDYAADETDANTR